MGLGPGTPRTCGDGKAMEETLHSIGEVAAATGLSTETLRMWERRYGKPEAIRLPSGHRRYTEAHIRWLRRVAEALARGHRPRAVIALGEAELDALLAPNPATGPADDREIAVLLDAVRTYDGVRIVEGLRAAWNPAAPLGFLRDRVAPLLEAVGRSWADGELEIRHEHLASALVEDLLRYLRAGYEVEGAGARVLLTTLPGETHALGLQMAALLCAARAVPTHVLGIGTPEDEIVRATTENGIEVVGLSISLATGGVETDRRLAALRERLPERVRLFVGGAGARGVRRGPRGVEYAETLEAWDRAMAALAARPLRSLYR